MTVFEFKLPNCIFKYKYYILNICIIKIISDIWHHDAIILFFYHLNYFILRRYKNYIQ